MLLGTSACPVPPVTGGLGFSGDRCLSVHQKGRLSVIFTFSVRRNPCRLIGGVQSSYLHFCGGNCELSGLPPEPRFVHIVTLDLRDPSLSFLQLDGLSTLPLIMDTAEGTIAYSVTKDGSLVLHASLTSTAEPLLVGPLPKEPMSVVPFSYEQYRASALATAACDETFLNAADQEALASLGEGYSQLGGTHRYDNGTSPYCANPSCLGYPSHSMQLLASLQTQISPGVSLDYCPNDPALLFFICGQCKSIAGEVAL